MLNETAGDFDVTETLRELEEEMLAAANNLEFEKAALLRDQIKELKRTSEGALPAKSGSAAKRVSYGPGRTRQAAPPDRAQTGPGLAYQEPNPQGRASQAVRDRREGCTSGAGPVPVPCQAAPHRPGSKNAPFNSV